MDTETLA